MREKMKYNEMSEWLCEETKDGLRSEEFYADLKTICKGEIDIKEYATVLKWLDAAFKAGRELKKREIKYSIEYDAHYYTDTYEWVDSKCLDPDCEYCQKRPDTAG